MAIGKASCDKIHPARSNAVFIFAGVGFPLMLARLMPELDDKSNAPEAPGLPAWTFSPLAVLLVLVVVTVGIYWPVTTHGFVDYDDADYVFANATVRQGLTWAGVKWACTTGHASNWHPLTWLSHLLDISAFGDNAGGHHLTSLLLHCINAGLVFLVWRSWTGANWPSVFVAALFAWHPLRVESVAWISERKDVLSGMFGLLSLYAYGRHAKSLAVGNRNTGLVSWPSRWYWAALACFALGLLSKPMLVTLPFVFLLLDFWPLGRASEGGSPVSAGNTRTDNRPRTPSLALVLEKLPFLVLGAGSSVATFLVQRRGGAVSPLESLPLGARIANAFVSYARYLKKTVWPDDLSVLYPHPGHWPAWQVGAAVGLVVAVSILAFLGRFRRPFVFVGWFWFVGMLVPVIGLVQVGIQSMADRYTYLPQLGCFVALVWWSAEAIQSRPGLRTLAFGVAVVVLAACASLTFLQVGIWKNSETLFRHAVRVTTDNYLAYNNLGFYLSNQGRTAEAITNFEASLRINPRYADAHNNLGHALAKQGRHATAIEHYEIALRLSPENVEIHNNLGNALAETGDSNRAMSEYRFVLARNPDHADAHNNLGIALAMQGQVTEAIRHFDQAVRVKPSDAGAQGNLGNAYAALRQWDEAIRHYREALRLAPHDAQTHNNLGNVLAEQGRLAEAVASYSEALRLKADNPEPHFNLGCAWLRLNDRVAAEKHLREALRLRPDYAAAREQLERLNGSGHP